MKTTHYCIFAVIALLVVPGCSREVAGDRDQYELEIVYTEELADRAPASSVIRLIQESQQALAEEKGLKFDLSVGSERVVVFVVTDNFYPEGIVIDQIVAVFDRDTVLLNDERISISEFEDRMRELKSAADISESVAVLITRFSPRSSVGEMIERLLLLSRAGISHVTLK